MVASDAVRVCGFAQVLRVLRVLRARAHVRGVGGRLLSIGYPVTVVTVVTVGGLASRFNGLGCYAGCIAVLRRGETVE